MKILVVCQHYWPEPYRLADICEEMARRGHEVQVVTGVPNYPMGHIYPEYKHGRGRRQERNGVKIARTFTIGRRNSRLFRFLNYYSFAISSTCFVRRMKEEHDLVFTQQTSPVMMSAAAIAWARKTGKKSVLYCQDLWPASLKMGGVGEKSPVFRFFGWVSRRIYRRADKILISSQMFRDYLRDELGVDEARMDYLPQYADGLFDEKRPAPGPKQSVDLVFAGNVGKAQSMPTLLAAAARLQDVPALCFHIVGDGSELEHTKEMARARGLKNVVFHGRRPLEAMPEFYAMADAMLLCLTADPAVSLTLPAKLQSYMAAGKPVLAASDGEVPLVIAAADCGFCVPAGDGEALAGAVREFLAMEDRERLGENARAYYQQHFARGSFMDRLETCLLDAAEREAAPV